MGRTERRIVLGTALASTALVVVHSVLWDAARWNGHEFMADTTTLVTIGARKATLFRTSLVADMLGSYLLSIPVTLALWRLLRREHDALIVDLLAIGGLIYAAAGAMAAAVWADAGAELIRTYDRTQSAATATDFATLARAAVMTWQSVCVLGAGLWWLGSGLMLRARWKWFARYSVALGGLSLVLGLMKVAGVEYNSAAPATAAFLPIGVWTGWLGVELTRTRP